MFSNYSIIKGECSELGILLPFGTLYLKNIPNTKDYLLLRTKLLVTLKDRHTLSIKFC